MKKNTVHSTISSRNGLVDMWNAFMVENATFSINDIPLCPTTAKKAPDKLIGFDEAKTIHKRMIREKNHDYHINAFIHFYVDDQKFDGKRSSIWLYPDKALEVIKHFSGIISPDFSTYADFPEPIKKWNFYRMNAFGYWIGINHIPVISNCRWGTEETWEYCFDGNPTESIIAIGSVASSIKRIVNRPLFEDGLFEMVNRLRPHTIIVYGSSNYKFFEALQEQGIQIISYPSRTSIVYAERRSYEQSN